MLIDSFMMKGIDKFSGPVGASGGGLLDASGAGPRFFPCTRPSTAHLGLRPQVPRDTQPWVRVQEAQTHHDHRQSSG